MIFAKNGSFPAKTQKNDQILSLHIPLGSYFTIKSIKIFAYGLDYSESLVIKPTELVQTLTHTTSYIIE